MLKLIKSLFKVAPETEPMPDDMPDHKGFRVVVYIHNMPPCVTTFKTLKAAQVAIMRSKQDALRYDEIMRSHRAGYKILTRKWTIQNLESGKFCPYIWQTTRQEVFAA